MATRLLRVLTAAVSSPAEADEALLALRRAAAGEAQGCGLMLFCDFAPSSLPRELDDETICRRLQSGVMAMAARLPGRFFLLVRRRAWDDAARAYLGAQQLRAPAQVVASLLLTGKSNAVFEAATVSPDKLKDRFDAALFAPASLACTPDTPARMLEAMERSGALCAGARILPPLSDYESALDRLLRIGFSLSPADAVLRVHLARHGKTPATCPALLCSPQALRLLAQGESLPPAALAQGCFFVRRSPLTVHDLFISAQDAAARAFAGFRRGQTATFPASFAAALPVAQVALLFAAGITGLSPLAAAAVALPEYPALLDARLLPGALVRVALLPAHAVCVLQALLERLSARAKLIRPQISDAARGSDGGVLLGGALLFAAFWGAGALVPLLPIALLWLSSPLLYAALSAPARERIPLSAKEDMRLRALAIRAADGADASASAPLRMLAACGRCMLGLSEPDEAARSAQRLLPEKGARLRACELAAMLACAQFLRERMADCDAALRELPAQIEDCARACVFEGNGLLAGLLRAALLREPTSEAVLALRTVDAAAPDACDALFLPFPLLRALPPRIAALALTHPHTFLRGALPKALPAAQIAGEARPDPAARFLFLAAASLGHPFAALLLRSGVVAPYAPLLAAIVHI